MLALAKEPVTSIEALSKLKGVGPSTVDKYGRDILAAIDKGMSTPKEQWPRMERPKRFPRDPKLEDSVKRMKAVRDKLALDHELRPGIIAANQLLLDMGRARPTNIDELLAIPGLRRYQAREFGPALLAVL